MRDAIHPGPGPAPLMTAINAESQVHLIIGSGPLAAARCARSLDTGACPIIITPETGDMAYTLTQHIKSGAAMWVKREFQDEDLTMLGREEVDRVVDMVFVTVNSSISMSLFLL